jgi:tetratricopeptide (TPR) repeat protein
MKKYIDNFLIEYPKVENQEERLEMLMDFINYYYDGHSKDINNVLEKELQKSIENNYIDEQALLYFMFSFSSFEHASNNDGEKYLTKVQELFERVKLHEIRAQILNFYAFLNSHRGNYDKAFEYCYASIKEGELSGSNKSKFWGVYSMGVFYFDLKDLENSEKYYKKALEGFTEFENEYGIARSETGLASVYIKKNEFELAEKLLNKSLEFYQRTNFATGQSRCLNDLGVILKMKGNYKEALACFQQSLSIRKATNHQQGIATSLNEIADVLLELKDFENAKKYLAESIEVCNAIKNRSKLFRAHLLYSKLYASINEPWKSLDHYKLYDSIKSEVLNESATNKLKELEKRMASEKAEKEAEIERLKNVELKKAYTIIEEKQKEIIDSIRYAKRIQESLLPSEKYIEKKLRKY